MVGRWLFKEGVLRSISEWSVFKYMLIAYIIFYIISVLFFIVIGLISLLGFSFSLFDFSNIFALVGMEAPAILMGAGAGGLGLFVIIIAGLLFSVFIAAFGAVAVWILNVVLKISGGIELRFDDKKKPDEE
jgi:hypothetical protein